MFTDEPDLTRNPDHLELLLELEKNTPENVEFMRSHERLSIRSRVVIHHANASQRHLGLHNGVTGDVSRGGCLILTQEPLLVGDIYHFTWDRSAIDSPPVLGRCMRCRYVQDGAFESGIAFFSPLDASCLGRKDVDGSLL